MFDQLDVEIVEYTIGADDVGPYGIAAGSDGAIYCTLVHAGAICRLGTAGDLQTFPTEAPDSGPMVIIDGPDDALWFTENRAKRDRSNDVRRRDGLDRDSHVVNRSVRHHRRSRWCVVVRRGERRRNRPSGSGDS